MTPLVIDLLRPRARRWVPVAAAASAATDAALREAAPWVPCTMMNSALGSLSADVPAACLHAPEVMLAGGAIPAGEPWSLAAAPEALLVVVAQLAPQSFAIGAGLLAHAHAEGDEAEAIVAELQRRIGGRWLLVRHPGLLEFGAAPVIANAVGAVDKRLATARARAALKGIVFTTTEADDGAVIHIASQGAWLREFRAIDEPETWLDRVEGRA